MLMMQNFASNPNNNCSTIMAVVIIIGLRYLASRFIINNSLSLVYSSLCQPALLYYFQ